MVTREILDVFVFSNKSTDTVVFWFCRLFRKNKSFVTLKIKTLNKICQQLDHSCMSAAFPKHWALVFCHLVSINVPLQEFDLTIIFYVAETSRTSSLMFMLSYDSPVYIHRNSYNAYGWIVYISIYYGTIYLMTSNSAEVLWAPEKKKLPRET